MNTYKEIGGSRIISGSDYNRLPYDKRQKFTKQHGYEKPNTSANDLIEDVAFGLAITSLLSNSDSFSSNDSYSSDNSSSSTDFGGGSFGGGGADSSW